MSIGMWVVLAIMIDRAQLVIGAPNYGTPYNGLGAAEGTMQRVLPAPMAYRVLVPWLVGMGERLGLPRLEVYEALKIALVAGALWSVEQAWGWAVAIVTAGLLVATFNYDYWDWAAEMMGVQLALTGRMELALVGVVIHALSRETAWLDGLAFGLAGGELWQAGVVFVVGWGVLIAVRLWAGKHELYCERWMWQENVAAVRAWWQGRPWWLSDIAMSVWVCGLAVAGAVRCQVDGCQVSGVAGWLVVLFLGAGWLMAKAEETRVFSVVLPWAAAFILHH